MEKAPLVSLIISNYNGKDMLKECLESLYKQNYPYYEIIVVDACSIDGAPQMVKNFFPGVKLIEVGRKIGIGEAINIGIEKAGGKLIGFDLNNDEVFSEDWLSCLVNVLLSDERIGVVGGTRLIDGTNQLIDDAGVITNAFGFDIKVGRGLKLSEIPKNPKEVSYTTTLLFRKHLLERIGLLDEVFYFYFEDSDFCERVRKESYKIVNIPRAISYHKVSSTLGQHSPKKLYFLRRGRIRFILKHYSGLKLLGALFFLIFIQSLLETIMIIPYIRNILKKTRLHFISNRGSIQHIKSLIKAFSWNVKLLSETLNQRNK